MNFFKPQDRNSSSLEVSWWLHDKEEEGYVLRSEPQTIRRRFNLNRCHFCIYQSAIGDEKERKKPVYFYTECFVNKASMYNLCYVDIVDSGDFFTVRIHCKSARAISLSILCLCEGGIIRCCKK